MSGKQYVTNKQLDAIASNQAKFDNRSFEGFGAAEKERYRERVRIALKDLEYLGLLKNNNAVWEEYEND